MDLANAIDAIAGNSVRETWRRYSWVKNNPEVVGLTAAKTASWRTPGEPALVSCLLEEMFENRRWWPTLIEILAAGETPKFTSVVASGLFIHQKPKIRAKRAHVELGDMLIVRQHLVIGEAAPQCWALLLQAKVSKDAQIKALTDKKELEQLQIYSDWSTPFTFPHGELGLPSDGSKAWQLQDAMTPKHHETGLYAVAFDANPDFHRPTKFKGEAYWAIGPGQTAAPNIDASSSSFGEVMAGLMRGTRGRPWSSSPAANDHWSQLVFGLLETAVANTWTYPLQRLGSTATSRMSRHREICHFTAFSHLQELVALHPKKFMNSTPFVLQSHMRGRRSDLAMREWLGSLDGPGGDGPGSPEALAEDNRQSGGVSVLYVGSVGRERIPEAPIASEQVTKDGPA